MAEIGDRIGPFEIIELLEQGRLSTLYRGLRADGTARQPREVVIRQATIGPEGLPLPEALDAVRAEYETLRVLQDERIPQAVALYGGHGASARMCVHGASLRDTLRLVEAGRIDLDAATSMDILVELAYALRHTHAIAREDGRIVHGAIAPEVVWLTADGRVRLLGLGDPEPSHPRPLAPEQQHGVQDPRTDQWLLGALGIELLRHAPEIVDQARGASVEVAYGLLQARWPEATRVLARLLAESPVNRFDGDERLIKELLALSRHLGGVSKRAEVGSRTLQLVAAHNGADTAPVVEVSEVDVPEPAAVRVAPAVRVPPAPAVRVEAPSPVRIEAPRLSPFGGPVPRSVRVEAEPEHAHEAPVAPPRMGPRVSLERVELPPFPPEEDEILALDAPSVPVAAVRVAAVSVPVVSVAAASVPVVSGPVVSVPAVSGPVVSVAAASVAAVPGGDAFSEELFVEDELLEGSGSPAVSDLLDDLFGDASGEATSLFAEAPAGPAVGDPSDRGSSDRGSSDGVSPDDGGSPSDGVSPADGVAPDDGDRAGGAPSAFRPTSRAVEDPVPDHVVIGAMVAFGLVTAVLLAWRLGGA